jgi:uncharacterized protein YodC (DUF2158 family)
MARLRMPLRGGLCNQIIRDAPDCQILWNPSFCPKRHRSRPRSAPTEWMAPQRPLLTLLRFNWQGMDDTMAHHHHGRGTCRGSLLMVRPAQGKSHAFLFKAANVTATVVTAGLILYLLPAGRYRVARLNSAIVRSTIAPRDPADSATMKRIRAAAIDAAKAAVEVQWANAGPSEREFFRETGLSPDQAVCRWGNGTSACILSRKAFEADELRSYRFRPNKRSVWLMIKPESGPGQALLVPDDPQVRPHGEALGYQVLGGAEQTTNSWGCRGAGTKNVG